MGRDKWIKVNEVIIRYFDNDKRILRYVKGNKNRRKENEQVENVRTKRVVMRSEIQSGVVKGQINAI